MKSAPTSSTSWSATCSSISPCAPPATRSPTPRWKRRISEMKAELKKVNREFSKMLTDLHVTEAELRYHIATDLRWLKYANAQVADKVLRDMFDKNKDMFDGTRRAGLAHPGRARRRRREDGRPGDGPVAADQEEHRDRRGGRAGQAAGDHRQAGREKARGTLLLRDVRQVRQGEVGVPQQGARRLGRLVPEGRLHDARCSPRPPSPCRRTRSAIPSRRRSAIT